MRKMFLAMVFVGFIAATKGADNVTPPQESKKAFREKAAREAAVAYARACHVKANRAAGIMNIAAVPFFAGEFNIGGSGPKIPIHAVLFEKDQDLRQWLEKGRHEVDLPLKVLRVERYADFRKKYLEKEPALGKWYELRLRQQQAARWALDESLHSDGLIVFLGEKSKLTQGILIRFEKGTAKVGGVLGMLNPDWPINVLKFIHPTPEKDQ